MVVLLLIITVMAFLLIDYFVNRKKTLKSDEIPSTVAISSKPYFHPTHTWLKITDDLATVGTDEFAQKLIGRINKLDFPPIGTYLKQGQTLWRLYNGKRELQQCSPVEGEVVEVNERIFYKPGIIGKSPYNEGWILRIKPYSIKQNIKNLLHGESAKKWLDTVRSQFILRFSHEVGPVCQDGGELIEGAGILLTDEEWQEVLKEFFMVE